MFINIGIIAFNICTQHIVKLLALNALMAESLLLP